MAVLTPEEAGFLYRQLRSVSCPNTGYDVWKRILGKLGLYEKTGVIPGEKP